MLFIKNKKEEPKTMDVDVIEEAIKKLTDELEYHDPQSEEAKAICENIKTLSEAKANITKAKPDHKLNMNTVVETGASILGVVLLGKFEKVSIIPQKAFSLLSKMFKGRK